MHRHKYTPYKNVRSGCFITPSATDAEYVYMKHRQFSCTLSYELVWVIAVTSYAETTPAHLGCSACFFYPCSITRKVNLSGKKSQAQILVQRNLNEKSLSDTDNTKKQALYCHMSLIFQMFTCRSTSISQFWVQKAINNVITNFLKLVYFSIKYLSNAQMKKNDIKTSRFIKYLLTIYIKSS